jgi:hypothetical protein
MSRTHATPVTNRCKPLQTDPALKFLGLRLSRRFYSPILPFEAYDADLRLCHPRRDLGRPPSAMRPWAPGFGVRAVRRPWQNRPRTGTDKPTDGHGPTHGRGPKSHGRGRWEQLYPPSA